MKNMFESEEVFEAYARIDLCYYMIEEVHKNLNKKYAPIEVMIHKATGYEQHEMKESKETLISLLQEIISSKKIIDEDYSYDENFIKQLSQLTPPALG